MGNFIHVAADRQQLWTIVQFLRTCQASSTTWNCGNSNKEMDLIKKNRLLNSAIFGCLTSEQRQLLVITENSFTPSIGFWKYGVSAAVSKDGGN